MPPSDRLPARVRCCASGRNLVISSLRGKDMHIECRFPILTGYCHLKYGSKTRASYILRFVSRNIWEPDMIISLMT